MDGPLPRPVARALRGTAEGGIRRSDFPLLHQTVHGKRLVYLDNAASTPMPQAVIDALVRYASCDHANVHRGVHALSQRATDAFEDARARVQRFLGATDPSQIVFVRGTTEAINLVAHSFVQPRLRAGDEILVSALEHHSNIVPWQMACARTGAHLRVVPLDASATPRLEEWEARIGPRTRFVALAHVSNAFGTVNDVARIVALAHARGVPVLVDGAQAAAHLPVDVCALDCDFYAFSGHKTCGPTGIGALYGKSEHLQEMPPYQGGGDMIRAVTLEATQYAEPPHRFEAGTPHIAGAVGLGCALEYLANIGLRTIYAHEHELLAYATHELQAIDGIRIFGTSAEKSAILSFTIDGIHPHDIGSILDGEGIAVRTGHHCAMPAMQHFDLPAGTARASFAFYNTFDDVDALVAATREVVRVFGVG
jgi:cysteine desulfurase/selenocysteine lyase